MGDSTGEIIDDERWEIEFPVWTIVDREKHTEDGIPKSLIVLTDDDGENYLPVFTDSDLAKRFIEDVQLTSTKPFKLKTPKALKSALLGVKKIAKVKNVGFDLSCKPKITGHFWTIEETLEAIEDA